MAISRIALYSSSSSPPCILTFTRYCCTSRLLCTNQASSNCPLPPALPALLEYDCTSIAQYTTPPNPPFVCHTVHHTILAMASSCKGQLVYTGRLSCRIIVRVNPSSSTDKDNSIANHTVPSIRNPPALPMRIAPGHPASLTPRPTAVTV